MDIKSTHAPIQMADIFDTKENDFCFSNVKPCVRFDRSDFNAKKGCRYVWTGVGYVPSHNGANAPFHPILLMKNLVKLKPKKTKKDKTCAGHVNRGLCLKIGELYIYTRVV